jgi:2-methylcitrate dehydratase PrpD
VEAALQARAALPAGTSVDDIEEVHLATHRPAMSNKHPDTSLAGKFSFDHVLATALVHGHAGASAFAATTLEEPRIARLRQSVRLSRFEPALPRPHDRPARLRLVLRDGREVHAECLSAQGGPARPFGPEVIPGKIDTLARGLSPRLADDLLALCELPAAMLARRWSDLIAR